VRDERNSILAAATCLSTGRNIFHSAGDLVARRDAVVRELPEKAENCNVRRDSRVRGRGSAEPIG